MSEMTEKHDPGFLTLSNLLTLSRIPLGVAFLAVNDPKWMGLIVFAAAFTDGLDGLLARTTQTQSHVGLLLDPLCDKLFVLLAVSSFLTGPYLGWAAFIIFVLRDIFTGGSFFIGLLAGREIPFRPRLAGKLTTALQLLTLLALIFLPEYVPLLVLLVGITSVIAIIDYGTLAIKEEQRQALAG